MGLIPTMMNLKHFVLLGIWMLVALVPFVTGATNETSYEGFEAQSGEHEMEEESEPHFALLFPWFVQILGVSVFFLITRFLRIIPFTAWMFLLGTIMGIAIVRLDYMDQLSQSIRIWESINSEVLLLSFLPGLIFKDAYSLNFHLFQVSFVQCFIMAFPMVLAGTVLVALVAFYIFPYGWSFNLALTLGCIMSATDPVAVSALLNEVGAPPRLKMHIAGESLLNDGSAIVFYTIFSGLFLAEVGPGIGHEVTTLEGFLLFFQMSIGGMLIGIAFGLGLVMFLYVLSHRLNPEENVMQVAMTIATAYLCYYTADVIAHTSGVIAVVFCGVFVKAFGASLINDQELMENFWVLVEHLLNTLLFAIGGCVWGTIISNTDPREFGGIDWAYLILLYVFLSVIRFGLIFAFYPLTSRIGLKSNWKEAFFMSHAGLRGAVGISLAIALDDEVFRNTDDPENRLFSTKLFGMTGGIAFLTLFINGSTAGALLKKLELTKSSEVHERLTEVYFRNFKAKMLDSFIHLLADPIFADVDFAVVRKYVPYIEDLTPHELKEAVLKNKENVPAKYYHKPHLQNVIPYLVETCNTADFCMEWHKKLETFEREECLPHRVDYCVQQSLADTDLDVLQSEHGVNPETVELRVIYLEIVRAAYSNQIEKGWLDVRSGSPGFVAFALYQGIEFAIDEAYKGMPMCDWEKSSLVSKPLEDYGRIVIARLKHPFVKKIKGKVAPTPEQSIQQRRIDVNRAIAFIEAHKKARRYFEEEFCNGTDLTESQKIIIKESMEETHVAEDFLQSMNKDEIRNILAHILCIILLNKASRLIEKFCSRGLLQEQEASEKIEEIEGCIEVLRHCAVQQDASHHKKSRANSDDADA